MTKIDQFESTFRSADKPHFEYAPMAVGSVLVVTDLEEQPAAMFTGQVKGLLSVLGEGVRWQTIPGEGFATVRDLLDLVETHRPDLVCTYRNLHSEGWRWPFTLGDHVEVLTQATKTPVLVLPHPKADRAAGHALRDTNAVMAVTDHMTGDDRLVNWAAAMTRPGGTLFLSHVEDDAIFERYIDVISRIETIDTAHARQVIEQQLLKEPAEFIDSCREAIVKAGLDLAVEPLVVKGHHLREYERLVEQHAVDLLVFNTKDDDQLAMHGLAYPLAVEMRHIPVLMI